MTEGPPAPSALEAALLRDRMLVLASLGLTVLLAWLYLVPMSLDMVGAMSGPARWMMASWSPRYAVLMFLMWLVMMTGMMLPSAAPTILLYATVVRKSSGRGNPAIRIHAFALGYLLAWAGFSVLATALQWGLSRAALLSPMMASTSPWLGAGLLCAAGLYQWSTLKLTCLASCRAPAAFIAEHWRPGAAGGLRMGFEHGLLCIGCCWGLMLLLFFGGVMSLAWIAAITIFVLVEKLAPFGARSARLSGALLMLAGLTIAALHLS